MFLHGGVFVVIITQLFGRSRKWLRARAGAGALTRSAAETLIDNIVTLTPGSPCLLWCRRAAHVVIRWVALPRAAALVALLCSCFVFFASHSIPLRLRSSCRGFLTFLKLATPSYENWLERPIVLVDVQFGDCIEDVFTRGHPAKDCMFSVQVRCRLQRDEESVCSLRVSEARSPHRVTNGTAY